MNPTLNGGSTNCLERLMPELSLEHLRHFEIGYDREYIGVGLHCLVCPEGDYGSHWVDGEYLDWKPLTEAAEMAMRHLREHHPELVEAQ